MVMLSAVAARRGFCLPRQSLDCLVCPPREPAFCFVARTLYALFMHARPIYSHTHTERHLFLSVFKFMDMYAVTISHLTHVFVNHQSSS